MSTSTEPSKTPSPTLQVLDSDGRLVWTSKTYWANATVLEEALNIMETGGL